MLHNGNNVRTYTQKGTFTLLRSVSWKYFGDFQYPEKGTSLHDEVSPGNILEISYTRKREPHFVMKCYHSRKYFGVGKHQDILRFTIKNRTMLLENRPGFWSRANICHLNVEIHTFKLDKTTSNIVAPPPFHK